MKYEHSADYEVATGILGGKPPHSDQGEEAPDSVQTKTEIMEYLKGSFVYLHRAVAGIKDETLVKPIPGTKGT